MKILKTFYIQIIFLAIILFTNSSLSQVVYTPPDDYVYEFLQRLSLKKIIEYHSEVKPIARIKIADFLKEASLKKDQLNSGEQKELDWLFEEYAYEIGDLSRLDSVKTDSVKQRWYLYSYNDSLVLSQNISFCRVWRFNNREIFRSYTLVGRRNVQYVFRLVRCKL